MIDEKKLIKEFETFTLIMWGSDSKGTVARCGLQDCIDKVLKNQE